MANLPLRRFFSRASNYYVLYGLACALVLCLCWLAASTGFALRELPAADYSALRCNPGPASGGPVLRVLDAVYLEETHLLQVLCATPWAGESYAEVVIHTAPRDSVNLREIYDRHYELVLAKPELMEQVNRTGERYLLIAHYPDYGSRLISLGEPPSLDPRWWQGRSLGLLDDPHSVSGYQIPKVALQRHGLEGIVDILYFRGHNQLHQALLDGSVDVIASATADALPSGGKRPVRELLLADKLPGPGWYLRADLLHTPLHCRLIESLKGLARVADAGYLRQLTTTRPCE